MFKSNNSFDVLPLPQHLWITRYYLAPLGGTHLCQLFLKLVFYTLCTVCSYFLDFLLFSLLWQNSCAFFSDMWHGAFVGARGFFDQDFEHCEKQPRSVKPWRGMHSQAAFQRSLNHTTFTEDVGKTESSIGKCKVVKIGYFKPITSWETWGPNQFALLCFIPNGFRIIQKTMIKY